MKFGRTKIVAGAAAIAGAAALIAAGPALAGATSFDMTVGGVGTGHPAATLTGHSVSFTDTTAHQTLTCTTFNLSGTTNPGTALPYPTAVAALGTLTSSGCTNPIAGATTVTPVGSWALNILGNGVSGVWPGSLTGVSVHVVAAGCSFNAGGTLNGSFNTGTQTLTPGTSALKITSTPTGALCPVIGVHLNDPISVAGNWTASPTIALT